MAPSISNDLDSPVSLLWAHQLRREHAAIVVQLEKLQDQHAPSPSELKRSVSRAEAASAKIRKELSELRTAHQKTAQATEALRRDLQAQTTTALEVVDIRREEQRHVESLRSEMRSLTALVERQQGELAGLAVEVRRMQQSRIEGREVVQEGDEIAVLRGRLDASGQRVVEAVTVVNDSVEHHGAKGFPVLSPPPSLQFRIFSPMHWERRRNKNSRLIQVLQKHLRLLKTTFLTRTRSTWTPTC